jgi:hypothetical protein
MKTWFVGRRLRRYHANHTFWYFPKWDFSDCREQPRGLISDLQRIFYLLATLTGLPLAPQVNEVLETKNLVKAWQNIRSPMPKLQVAKGAWIKGGTKCLDTAHFLW